MKTKDIDSLRVLCILRGERFFQTFKAKGSGPMWLGISFLSDKHLQNQGGEGGHPAMQVEILRWVGFLAKTF